MNPSEDHSARTPAPVASPEEAPDLPGFRTWRGVYWFVIGWFLLLILLLTLLSRAFP